ncbi:MAG TPA: nucleotidyltransferase family protein [Pyrinomonadaceae bacterium]|nr:nucleotidyltransferase family protein [Pyrinomonadaceae bacterium]
MSANTNQILEEMPPEIALLLACGRTQVSEEIANRIRALAQRSPDWDLLIQTSLTHGLMPLLYENLKAYASDLVPQASLNKLKGLHEMTSARSILLTAELIRILSLFESKGLPAMPYKGPSIAISIYGRLGLRQFIDLDILVRKQDVWDCQELLISLGYQPHFNITRRQLPAFLKLGYVQMFTRDNGMSVVELHWGIASRFFMFDLDTERFWSRLVHMDLMGKQVLSPAPPDLLLILCVHGAKDMWERLEWICGIAELVRKHDDLDWDSVRSAAQETGAERRLHLGCYLARELFEAKLPESIARRIDSDRMIPKLAAEVRENIVKGTSLGVRQRILFHLRTKDGDLDRVRYCARLLFTSTPVDWQILPLPPSLSFLYPLLRPFRLAKKYAVDQSKILF